jgi:hypothetical protein
MDGGTLGVSGGARGEDQVRKIIGLHAGGPRRRHGRMDALAGLEKGGQSRDRHCGAHTGSVARGGRGVLVAQEDDTSQVAGVLARQHGRIVEPEEAAHGDERRGAGVADDVGRFTTLEPGVQRDEHGAGAEQPECRQHPLGAIGRPDSHAIPGTHAGGQEAAAVALDLLGQLRVGETEVAVDQRLRAAVPQRSVVDQARHRAPEEIGPRVLLVGRSAADSGAHGCWLLTEMTSPER